MIIEKQDSQKINSATKVLKSADIILVKPNRFYIFDSEPYYRECAVAYSSTVVPVSTEQ